MGPIRTARLVLPAATALVAMLAFGHAHAQSATDASGKPVGAAGSDGLDIKQTDGLIRYGNAEEMWQEMSSRDDMVDLATERWPEIEATRFDGVGSREDLISLVAEGYSIEESDATREVNAWVSEKVDNPQ